jgi:hypothetical protein
MTNCHIPEDLNFTTSAAKPQILQLEVAWKLNVKEHVTHKFTAIIKHVV